MIIRTCLSYVPELALWQLIVMKTGRTYLAPTRGEVIDRCLSAIPEGKTIRIST